MTLKDQNYAQYYLVQEMMGTVPTVEKFDPHCADFVADSIRRTGAVMFTGEGSSRIMPAKNARRKAMQLGLKYNINYWFFELNAQCYARSFLDMNPLYRTEFANKGCFDENGDLIYNEDVYKGGSAHFYYMTDQEEFKPAFLLNASIGKSWYVKNNQIGFSLQVNNITNNRGVKTGGYEQTRLQNSSDKDVYYRFQSKYFYMAGINYMLNLYFRF